MFTPARLVAVVAILALAAWHSRTALIAASGTLTAVAIVLWRMQRERDQPEPVTGPPLEQAAEQLAEAEIRGNAVVTTVADIPTAVDAWMAPARGGVRLPVFRVRMKISNPIPFCFTIRRRRSPFAVDALVRNTPIERPAFEYELHKIAVGDPAADRIFEVAANLPRMMARLLEAGLAQAIGDACEQHDFRLEEFTYDGARATALLLSAADPRQAPLAEAAIEHALRIVEPAADFIREEGLEGVSE